MNFQKDKILIVEDDAGLLELLCDEINESGYDVFCAISAEIAFNWLKDNQPALMLLDYRLSDMNGSEFIAELASRNIAVPPLILTTGQGDERIAVEMMKLGARDYIIKDTNYLEKIPLIIKKISTEIENENKLELAETEIKRIGKHYQSIIEKAPDGLVLLNQEGHFKFISPSAKRIFGYDKDQDITIHPDELTHPEDLSMVLMHLGKMLENPDYIPKIEYRFAHKNGNWIWIESTFSNLLADPNVESIVINFREITDRIQAEEKIRQSEVLHRTILETALSGFLMLDKSGNIKEVNQSYSTMSGFSIPELLTMNISDFETPEYNSHIDYILNEGLTRFETKHKRRDNSTYDVDISVQYKSSEGDLMVLFVRDNTERKNHIKSINQNQEILNKLLSDSSKLIDYTDENIDYEYFTNSILQISGAKYAAFNLYENNGKDFRSVALCGIDEIYSVANRFLGFDLKTKVWKYDSLREFLINDQIITQFENLYNLTYTVMSKTVSKLIENTFNLGKVVRLNIPRNDKYIGDFTLFFLKGEELKNKEALEIYAGQLGLFLGRLIANKNLVDSEQKYRILFSGNPQPMLVYDLETLKIMEVNHTAELFYGYNREELLSMYIDQLHPKSEKSFVRNLVKITKNGFNTDNIYNHVKNNGELVFVETSTVSAPTFGPNARHVLIKDVTERKKAEDEVQKSLSLLNATIESTADGILVVDTEGRTSLYNQKFAQMWGIPNDLLESGLDDQLLRYVMTKLIDSDQFLSKVTQLYKNPELSSIDNIQLADGRTFVRHSIPQRISDLVVGRVWSFRDITDRLIAEKALQEKMNEMTRFHNLTIGRELTMIELKKEINELLKLAGKEEKYKIVG